jgi:hypothetical protein
MVGARCACPISGAKHRAPTIETIVPVTFYEIIRIVNPEFRLELYFSFEALGRKILPPFAFAKTKGIRTFGAPAGARGRRRAQSKLSSQNEKLETKVDKLQ